MREGGGRERVREGGGRERVREGGRENVVEVERKDGGGGWEGGRRKIAEGG